jgi:hypothetical protein
VKPLRGLKVKLGLFNKADDPSANHVGDFLLFQKAHPEN